MRKLIVYGGIILGLTCACGVKEHQQDNDPRSIPQVLDQGKVILFSDIPSISFFITEPVGSTPLDPDGTGTLTIRNSEGNLITIDKSSLVKAGKKNYVFVKKSSTHFERTEITIGKQIRKRIIVQSGLRSGDLIAVHGVVQLKEYSFNY